MSKIPATYKALIITKLTANFREAAQLTTVNSETVLKSLKGNQVFIKNIYAGINASDINHSAGRYNPKAKPPFPSGFESIGTIVAVGSNVKGYSVGSNVISMGGGAFAEYNIVDENNLIPIPKIDKGILGLFVTGLTSSIALDVQGEMKENGGETVLVTAAAGGAGQIAVQLAKLSGNHVIGTCSSDEKVAMLKKLGCDRVINYKKENFGDVLAKEYPKGIDIIYESVGGDFLTTSLKNLAPRGRLIVIGAMNSYKSNSTSNIMSQVMTDQIPSVLLLQKSLSVKGFLLFHFPEKFPEHLQKLFELYQTGALKVIVDDKFQGIESVYDAVDHLQNGKNIGKVIVSFTSDSKL